MKHLLAFVTSTLLLWSPPSAAADEVTLVAPGGIRAAIVKLIPGFEQKTGHKVIATFGSGLGTKAQVARGPDAAKALLSYLSSAAAAAVYRAVGMQPGR